MRTRAVQEVFMEIRDLQGEEGWGLKRMIRVGFQRLWGSGAAEKAEGMAGPRSLSPLQGPLSCLELPGRRTEYQAGKVWSHVRVQIQV